MSTCTCSKLPNKAFQPTILSSIRYVGALAELER